MGSVTASYFELRAVFGPPNFEEESDARYEKTSTEWRGQINGHIFTIYDYKWRRDSDSSLENWHVGGQSKIVELLINERLKRR